MFCPAFREAVVRGMDCAALRKLWRRTYKLAMLGVGLAAPLEPNAILEDARGYVLLCHAATAAHGRIRQNFRAKAFDTRAGRDGCCKREC